MKTFQIQGISISLQNQETGKNGSFSVNTVNSSNQVTGTMSIAHIAAVSDAVLVAAQEKLTELGYVDANAIVEDSSDGVEE